MCTFRPHSINLSLQCVPTPCRCFVDSGNYALLAVHSQLTHIFKPAPLPCHISPSTLLVVPSFFFSSTILLFGTFQRAMSLQILISRPVAESAYASPILRTDLIVLRNAMMLRLRTVESDASAQSHSSKRTLWDSPMSDLLSISLEDGKVVILPAMLAGIYNAASQFRNGVKMVAVFGNKLVLYSVAPDVFKLSHREQQNDRVLQPLPDDEIAHVERLRWWAGSGMEDTRGRPMAVWSVFSEGTFFGGLGNIVHIAVDDGCCHIVERIARGGRELDMDNDAIMADAEDEDDRFVAASIAAPRRLIQ